VKIEKEKQEREMENVYILRLIIQPERAAKAKKPFHIGRLVSKRFAIQLRNEGEKEMT